MVIEPGDYLLMRLGVQYGTVSVVGTAATVVLFGLGDGGADWTGAWQAVELEARIAAIAGAELVPAVPA